ncbi:MAG: hypothetical protein EBZ49_06240 [Proteobacteria bacterium]|nr:hypothetical protein [Pseudomonadota bacterium]
MPKLKVVSSKKSELDLQKEALKEKLFKKITPEVLQKIDILANVYDDISFNLNLMRFNYEKIMREQLKLHNDGKGFDVGKIEEAKKLFIDMQKEELKSAVVKAELEDVGESVTGFEKKGKSNGK